MGSLSSSMATSMNSLSSSMGSIMATTGSNLFKGNQTISGSIIPAVNGLYDLGSITNEFRDLYLSSASLYIDGTKVLGSTTQELQITTDAGQSFKILEAGSDTITLQAADGNITLATSGGGDVILDPTSGLIALKGTTTLYAGNKILSSDGNAIQIGNSVTMTGSLVVTGFIETQELRTTYISSSILYRSGSTKFGDELGDTHSFTGSLTVSGSISVPDSGLVSGSSQITYGGLSGVPSGIISGSAQLPSGIVSSSAQTIANLPSGTVSGSVQVDVMSTTNIARLATTGSNVFTSNQIVSGSLVTTSNIGVGTPSPQYKLDVYTAGATSAMRINSDTAQNSQIRLEENGSIKFGITYVPSDSTTRFYFAGAGSDLITLKGNSVGIGTPTPVTYGTRNLDVNAGSGSSSYIVARANSNGGTVELAFDTDSGYLSTKSNHPLRIRTNDTTRLTFSTGGTATFSGDIITSGTFYGVDSGPSIYQNRINAGWNSVGDGIDLWINYEGYQNGISNFRDFRVGNGKRGSSILFVDGSEGTTTLSGNLIMSKAVDPKISSDTGIGLNIDGSALYLNRYSQSNISMVPNGGNVIIGSGTTSSSLDISSRTDAITLPRGTTAQRPGTSVAGMGRFNTTTTRTEFFNGNVWVNVGGNADGSTSSSAAASAKAIKQVVGNPTSGVYWLQVPNVNGGNPFQCYCDFTMDGGIGYAIIFNQYFEGAESGPAHASFASSTITTAGFDSEYQVAPTAMVSNYGLTKLAVFARTGGVASGGITGATYYNWAAFTGPTTTQFNNIFTNGYNGNQFTGTFNSSDGNTGTAYFPNGHGNTGGVTQITNGDIVNNYIIYEYKQGGGTDPNHFWMVANGRNGDTYWVNNNRYGSGSGNVMYNRWGGVALY